LKVKLFFLTLCLAVLLIGCNSADEKKASMFFDEGIELITKAQSLEVKSYTKAFELYQQALDKFNKIRTDYPETKIGKELSAGDKAVGDYLAIEFTPKELDPGRRRGEPLNCSIEKKNAPLTFKYFQNKFISDAEMRAKGEKDPLFCTKYIDSVLSNCDEELSTIGWYSSSLMYDQIDDDFEKSLILTNYIDNKDIKTKMLEIRLQQYSWMRLKQKSKEDLKRYFKAAESIEDEKFKAQFRSEFLWDMIRIRDVKLVEEYVKKLSPLVEKLNDKELNATLLAQKGAIYRLKGKKSEALDYLEKALKEIDSSTENISSFWRIALEFKKNSENQRAEDLLLMIAKDKSIKKHTKTYYYKEMAKEWVFSGYYDDALLIVNKISDGVDHMRALESIAFCLFDSGKLSKSIATLEMIEKPTFRIKAYIDMAFELTEMGKRKTDTEILFRALDIVNEDKASSERTLGNVAKTGKNLAKIVKGFVKAGQIQIALREVEGIEGSGYKARALAYIALEYQKLRKEKDVGEILKKLENLLKSSESTFNKNLVINAIARIRLSKDDFLGALEMAKNNRQTGLDYRIFEKLLENEDYKRIFEASEFFEDEFQKMKTFSILAIKLWSNDKEKDEKAQKFLHDVIFDVTSGDGKQ